MFKVVAWSDAARHLSCDRRAGALEPEDCTFAPARAAPPCLEDFLNTATTPTDPLPLLHYLQTFATYD